MQEIHLASAILLFLTRASPLSFGGGQVEKHWYRYVWGHLTTNTLQHNRFEPKHAKIIFLVTFQTIPQLTAYDCFWKAPLFLHLHLQAVTDVLGQPHPLCSRGKCCYCLLYCLRPNTPYAKE